MRRILISLVVLSIVVGGGVALAAPPVDAVRIGFRVDPSSADGAEALADSIADGTLSKRATRDPANAKLFLHLAAGARDPKVVAVALNGMGRTWSRDGRGDRPKVDKDFKAVIQARLGDRTPEVRAGALAGVRLIIGGEKTDPKMLAHVVKMTSAKGAPDRAAALQALFNVRDFQIAKKWPGKIQGDIVAAHLARLDDSAPYVIAIALRNLSRAAFPGIPDQAKLQAKARVLAKNERPEIRGTAIQLVAGLASSADLERGDGALLVAALGDKDAHVRAAAAMGIGNARYLAGAHGMVALLDDTAKSSLAIKGFTALDGRKGRVPLPAHGGRVDDTVLESMRLLTAKSKMKFEFGSLGLKERKERRAAAVAAAKAWYATNKDKLPKAPAAPKAAAAPATPEAKAAPTAPAP